MKKAMLAVLAVAVWAIVMFAQNPQNIVGAWQGTLKPPGAQLRVVIQVSLEDDKYKAVFYSIDQRSPAIPATTFTRDGAAIKMAIAAINGTFEGKLSADGNTISGTFNQGFPLPLDLVVTGHRMDEFVVSSAAEGHEAGYLLFQSPRSGASSRRAIFILLLNQSGMLNTTATSLSDLIKFAYSVHPKQITGGPSWIESDRYDITGSPTPKAFRTCHS